MHPQLNDIDPIREMGFLHSNRNNIQLDQKLKTQFIYDNFINNNSNIQFYNYNELPPGFYRSILDKVRKVYTEFYDSNLGKL